MNKWSETFQRGRKTEEFVKQDLFPSVGVNCVLNNKIDQTSIDMKIGTIPVEVKTAFTPYPSSPTPAGLSAEEHLTLDYSNIEKYDDNVRILFIVRYKEPRVCWILTKKVKQIIQDNPQRVYLRSGRTFKDKYKKIGIALSECEDITHLFAPNILAKINSL